jgi:DNA segregation ATPase FtsK/SpoIIIE, S-DNA-T family
MVPAKQLSLDKWSRYLYTFSKMKKGKEQQKLIGTNELLLKNEIIGIILLFVAIFFLFSVVSYNPSDPSFFNSTPDSNVSNFGGKAGAQVSAFLFNLFGYSSYVLLFYMLFMTTFFLINKKIQNIITKSAGYFLLLVSFAAFISSVKPYVSISGNSVKSGGILGFLIDEFFRSQIKRFFTVIFFLVLIFIALILIAKLSLRRIMKFVLKVSASFGRWAGKKAQEQYARYQRYRSVKRIQEKYNVDPPKRQELAPVTVEKTSVREKILKPKSREKKQIIRQPSHLPEEGSLFADLDDEITNRSVYQPPPITYLDAPSNRSQIDFKELENKKEELGRRLEEFRIRGHIVEYTPGPVITTYEFVPDTGVKVKDVTNLSEDLALVAKAQYVRIERILGKKAIGIEVPNKKREIIHLREILESDDYKESRSPLTVGIGKSKNGEIFITDLREMPHLIIAGATGSGKSVAIHTVLLSILYKSAPEDVKLVLIDPKRVELALYNKLPHLLTPVVVDTKLAKNALDWAVFEMENRYKKLALLQVRHLDQFNKKLELLRQTEDEEMLEKLGDTDKIPYIVIVIDEFADLMMEAGKEIEVAVARIAQKARAVGIHLILATQRPSTDVITGTIKNNFPSRVALAVPSKHDSRTIIDVMGAEKLLGHGDMLFLPPKTATLVRLHCAYVSEEETLRVVNYLSKVGKPKFNTQVLKPRVDEDAELAGGDLDDMFYQAAEVVIATGQASASFLQRKMSIGYARAGRLIDQLQHNGVVSAPDSKNKREILMTREELQELKNGEFS